MAGDRRPGHSRHASRITKPTIGNGAVRQRDQLRQDDDKQTLAYIKSILCSGDAQTGPLSETLTNEVAAKSLDELLPPLTSSNEMDVQLYAIIAVVLNQFVQSWYKVITSDEDFVNEIVHVIAHCTRGIEQRLRHVDLLQVLLDELPALLLAHIDGEENRYTEARHPLIQSFVST